jgi:hypothetical protein
LIVGTGARDAVTAYRTTTWTTRRKPSWGHIIAYILGVIFVLLANIGWWGGWIALIVWAVMELA